MTTDVMAAQWRSVIDEKFLQFVTDNTPKPLSALADSIVPNEGDAVSPSPTGQSEPVIPYDPNQVERPSAPLFNEWDIVACYDTEYCPDYLDANPGSKNFLLSMQMAAWVRDGEEWHYVEGFRFPDGHRPTVAGVVGWLLDLAKHPRKDEAKVLLVAHYVVAEWAMLKDRADYNDQLMTIGRTLLTTRPISVKAVREYRNQTPVALTLRDTMLLTPGRGGLHKASEMTSVKKIKLPPQYVGDSLAMLYRDPELFEQYAMNDVRSGLEYLAIIGNRVESIAGVRVLPLTLGGLATTGFKNWLDGGDGYGLAKYHGHDVVVFHDKFGNQKTGYKKSINRIVTDAIATSCFSGGRNYAERHGKWTLPSNRLVVDLDLAGAYSGAMGCLAAIDFKIPPQLVISVADLTSIYASATGGAYMPIAMGEVEFAFPDDVEPCLPVPTDAGLLYPLRGISHCGLPEVLMAMARGAQITLRSFYRWTPIVDPAGSIVPAFAEYLGALARLRDKYPKGSAENKLIKEIINSLYGKTAQGAKERKVRNLSGHRTDLPASGVTNVVFAAAITSLVRAALCALEDSMRRSGGEIIAATTDGAMGVFPVANNSIYSQDTLPNFKELVPALADETDREFAIRAIKQGRLNLGQDPEQWLEVKHLGDAFAVFKTRGYWMSLGGEATFIAKGGHKLDGKASEVMAAMDTLFDEETPSVLDFKRLVSCYDISDKKAGDLVSVDTSRSANFDWDWKRDLLDDGTSKPFETIGEIYRHRQAARNIRKSGNRATREAVKLGVAGVKLQGGSEATIHRMLLRAIVRRAGGWTYPKSWTNGRLADCLGVPVSTIKNARLREYRPQTLPRGPIFERVAEDLCQRLKVKLTDAMRDLVCIPE